MKFLFIIFVSVYSLFGCGYSISDFYIEPKSSNIQMLLEKEAIILKQTTYNNQDYTHYDFQEFYLKYGEPLKEAKYNTSFFAIIDKDIYCYDIEDSSISLQIKKQGDGVFEPTNNMINNHSYCFLNKEEIEPFILKNKIEIEKQKEELNSFKAFDPIISFILVFLISILLSFFILKILIYLIFKIFSKLKELFFFLWKKFNN